jgi:hypothetical protein
MRLAVTISIPALPTANKWARLFASPAKDGVAAGRAPRPLWPGFTPHRLVRRYSDYAWLNATGAGGG